MQEASTLTTRSQTKKAGESIPLELPSTDENRVVDKEKPKQKYVERSDKLCEPLKQAVDQIQKLTEALKQEQVRGAEREEAMSHLQVSLNNEQRRLSDVRDAMDKEMQLTTRLESVKSNGSLLKAEPTLQKGQRPM